MNQPNSIETEALTAGYGNRTAIEGITLEIPRKTVFALLGAAGAGKSTLLRVLVNRLRPSSGTATVSGVPCRRLQPEHFSRIGFVAQTASLPGWMEAGAYLNYCRRFYPSWDDAFCATLTKSLQLKLDRKIRQCAPGVKAKLALVAALAFRPAVLLIDDPFSQVDRRERDAMIRGVMELIDIEDWCIVIAARETDEVERMADWVGLLHKGRLEFAESMASLQRRFRLVEAFTMEPRKPTGGFPETWLRPRFEGHRLHFLDTRFDARETAARVHALLGEDCAVESRAVSVRDIFDELDKTYGLSAGQS